LCNEMREDLPCVIDAVAGMQWDGHALSPIRRLESMRGLEGELLKLHGLIELFASDPFIWSRIQPEPPRFQVNDDFHGLRSIAQALNNVADLFHETDFDSEKGAAD